MKISFRIMLIVTLLTTALFSCVNDMEVVNKYIDAETEPDLAGNNIEILYSDSARLQTRMITPLLKSYESAKEQRMEFPEGLHAWFYGKDGKLKAEITANWAKHDLITDLWEARSNVVLTNDGGQKLETEQLFWDPGKGIVYSEKHPKITSRDGTVATGDTFTARQDFTEWKLSKGKATIVLKDEEPEPENQP
jgi:LPS export ABC transporter protein LptC